MASDQNKSFVLHSLFLKALHKHYSTGFGLKPVSTYGLHIHFNQNGTWCVNLYVNGAIFVSQASRSLFCALQLTAARWLATREEIPDSSEILKRYICQ